MKLKVKNLEFGYNSTLVLEGVSMDLDSSEIVGIVGPNGAGKSTLIRCIDRILTPRGGTILLDETDISTLTRMEIAKEMGYVPQTTTRVFPATVFDTVLRGGAHISAGRAAKRMWTMFWRFWNSSGSWSLRCGTLTRLAVVSSRRS